MDLQLHRADPSGLLVCPRHGTKFHADSEIWLPRLTYGVYLVLSLKPGATRWYDWTAHASLTPWLHMLNVLSHGQWIRPLWSEIWHLEKPTRWDSPHPLLESRSRFFLPMCCMLREWDPMVDVVIDLWACYWWLICELVTLLTLWTCNSTNLAMCLQNPTSLRFFNGFFYFVHYFLPVWDTGWYGPWAH